MVFWDIGITKKALPSRFLNEMGQDCNSCGTTQIDA